MNIQTTHILEDTTYIDGITEMLRNLLRQVIREREPTVFTILHDPSELDKPLGFLPRFQNMSEEATELLGLLDLNRETINGPDPAAIGTFSLSMTKCADDLLGLYLLAKYCGVFSDVNSRESCRLKIVPLFETIEPAQWPCHHDNPFGQQHCAHIDCRQWRGSGNHAGLF